MDKDLDSRFALEQRKMSQPVPPTIRDVSIYFAARVIPALLVLGSVAVLTRHLPGPEFGRYALVISTVGLLNAVFFSWNNQSFYRYLADTDTCHRETLLSTVMLGFALSMMLVVSFGLGVTVFSGMELEGFSVSAVVFLLAALSSLELLGFRFSGERRPGEYALLQIGRAAGTLLAGGAAAFWTGSATAVIVAVALSWMLLAFALGLVKWALSTRVSQFNRNLARELFRYGAPLTFAMALMQGVSTVDRVLLKIIKGDLALGEYAVAFDLAQFALGTLGSAVSLALLPSLLSLYGVANPQEIDARLRALAVVLVSILLPAAVGMTLTSDLIVQIMVGPELRTGAQQVLPWVTGAMFVGVVKSFYVDVSFQLTRWTRGSLIVAAVALLTTACLDLLLIPRLGAAGAGQASLGGFLVAFVVSLRLGSQRAVSMPLPFGELFKIVGATLVMAVVISLIDSTDPIVSFLLKVGVGGATYAAAALLLDVNQVRGRLANLRATSSKGARFQGRQAGQEHGLHDSNTKER